MEIKEFFVKDENAKVQEPEKRQRKKTKITYETIAVSGPDFVIRRKTAKTERLMAILPSQGQFYIKDGNSIEELTEENMTSFMAGAEEDVEVKVGENECFWLDYVKKGKENCSKLLNDLKNNEILDAIKKNIFFFTYQYAGGSLIFNFFNEALGSEARRNALLKIIKQFDKFFERKETLKNLYVHFEIQRDVVNELLMPSSRMHDYEIVKFSDSFCLYNILNDWWGAEGVNTYIERRVLSPCSRFYDAESCIHRWATIFYHPKYNEITKPTMKSLKVYERKFNMKSFFEYLFVESSRQGFMTYVSNFLDSWGDYYNMQMEVYGKIKDKYSKHLLTDERILSEKYTMVKAMKDREKFESAVKKLQKYEYAGKDYMIIAPKTQEDLIDEGRQQSNCVASYYQMIINGTQMVFFMRRRKAPEESLVTISVLSNGDLGQVLTAYNRQPDDEWYDFVKRWHNKLFVKGDFSNEDASNEDAA